MVALFEHYPQLGIKLPYVSLAKLPTPVHKLIELAGDIGVADLYIKRDDLCGIVYGGNKLRKLEFILGKARRCHKKEVLIISRPEYKHTLTTSICAQNAGLGSISMLLPGNDGALVRQNLLMSHYCGTELHQYRNMPLLSLATACEFLRHGVKTGSFPVFVRGSRSCPLGTIGYVNAAFELKKQIDDGEMPEPDRIYVALSSMGTAVGLMIGLKAAKLKSEIVSVRALNTKMANARKMVKLFHKTIGYLNSLDPSFPKLELPPSEIDIRLGSYCQESDFITGKVIEAKSQLEKSEGVKLDRDYTENAFTCLITDAEKGELKDKVALFWHTYDCRDLSNIISTVDYRELPRCFHRYFEGGARKDASLSKNVKP